MGPELLFEYRYSTMMNTVFITLMYGTGMPILYLFAAISLFLSYWVDKATILRIYQTPPRYDITLQKTTREWTNLAILFHFLIGFWMFSNSIIFDSGDEDIAGASADDGISHIDTFLSKVNLQDRINSWHTLAYFSVFVLFILFFCLRIFCLGSCRKLCSCCCKKSKLKQSLQTTGVFCENYFASLDKVDGQNNDQKIYDDIKKYKKLKKELTD